MGFQILIEDKALKKIEKLESGTRERILKALPKLSELFRVRIDVVKLAGYTNKYRYRIGDYRVLFEVEGNKIKIFDVLHRGEGLQKALIKHGIAYGKGIFADEREVSAPVGYA